MSTLSDQKKKEIEAVVKAAKAPAPQPKPQETPKQSN